MAETTFNANLEVSLQKGDRKKMPMGEYGYGAKKKKRKKKGRFVVGENHDYSKPAMTCVGKDTPNDSGARRT